MSLSYLLAFLVMASLDFVWAEYTRAIAQGKGHYAGLTSSVIILLASYVTKTYVADYWTIIPSMAGAYVGTYCSIRWGRH